MKIQNSSIGDNKSSMHSTPIATIFNIIPNIFPFLALGKWFPTNWAYFEREVCFSHLFSYSSIFSLIISALFLRSIFSFTLN
jgi:hypothetical protein